MVSPEKNKRERLVVPPLYFNIQHHVLLLWILQLEPGFKCTFLQIIPHSSWTMHVEAFSEYKQLLLKFFNLLLGHLLSVMEGE